MKWFCLILLLCYFNSKAQYVVSGTIYDTQDSVGVAGLVVSFTNLSKFTVTNDKGFFKKKLKGIPQKVIIKSMAYETVELDLNNIQGDTTINIYLHYSQKELSELVITSNSIKESLSNPMVGVTKMSAATIKKLPSLGGEKDLMKALMLLPGIKSISEGSAGMYVRGGSPDQNLILFNNAPIYTSNQFFGLLSTFNTDAIKNIELYKGGIPAKYGGRISSVLSVHSATSKMDKFDINGNLGLITAKIQIDIPIIKNKAGILFSTRRNYFDLLKNRIPTPQLKNGIPNYHFEDYTFDFTCKLNTRNELKIYSYLNKDIWNASKDESYGGGQKILYKQTLGNRIWGVNLNSIFSKKFQNIFNVNSSTYEYKVANGVEDTFKNEINNFRTGIVDNSITNHVNWFASNAIIISAGLRFANQKIIPHLLDYSNAKQEISIKREQKSTNELTFYNDFEWKISSKLKSVAGYRITNLKNDTSRFWIEPRFALNFSINDKQALKFGYQHITQWLHLISNPGLGPIEDIWVASNNKVSPQKGFQATVAYEREININRHDFLLKSDIYYKEFKNIIAYKDGFSSSNFTIYSNESTPSWESFVTQGKGKSYGLEFLLEKKQGKFNGWIGYTLSWTKHQFDELNNGKLFFARYDRRHDISVVLMYNFNAKWSFSTNWIYGTGQATTIPIQIFSSPLFKINANKFDSRGFSPTYASSDRNAYRMKDIHRLDMSLQRNVKHRWGEGIWDLSIYNVYNRRNPLYYYMGYNVAKNSYSIYSVSIFPIIGSISYNFRPFWKK